MKSYEYYRQLFQQERLPLAYVDMDLLDENIDTIAKRAGNKAVRIATKSLRCRFIQQYILEKSPQYRGQMCYSVEEAVWLSQLGFDDLLVAYPTLLETAIRAVAAELKKGKKIYLMSDSPEHLKRLQQIAATENCTLLLCVDLDMSGRWSFLHFGVHRSGLWNKESLADYLNTLKICPNLKLCAAMGYEAQIAGVGDKAPGKTLLNPIIAKFQQYSRREVALRRKALVAQILAQIPDLSIVNGGGTGSLESTKAEDCVTELAAGSGFYAPALFDAYSNFRHLPAAGFALEVVRRPQPHIYTCLGGGYVASGAIGKEKVPLPYLPEGMQLTDNEMAGEVQTPIIYKGELPLGAPVLFRHSKAGELCEHFQELLLIRNGSIIDRVKTYRGEGKCFL